MPLRLGEKLANKYKIESALGEGGFGYAYLARHLKLSVPCVIKELRQFKQREIEARFVSEAQTMAHLSRDNPHVVFVYDLLTPDDFPGVNAYYIVMEYMAGGSLDHWLNREKNKRLPINQVIKIVIDVCQGLVPAHAQKIVHRDIKPQNILLSENGEVIKVADWGIAHLPDFQRTRFGEVMGSLPYMSVEQALGDIIDPRSDLYSVGAMLFEMVTGHYYLDFYQIIQEVDEQFLLQHRLGPQAQLSGQQQAQLSGLREEAKYRAIIHRQPEKPTRYNPDIPPALEAIILKALTKSPRDRFQTANEMIEALKRVGLPTNEDIRVDKLLEQVRNLSGRLKYEPALELLEQAKAIAPNDPRIYSEMAAIYNLMRRHTDASQLLETAVKIKPNDPALFRDLGLTYHKLGQTGKTIKALERSLELDSKQPGIRALLKGL